MEYIWHAVKYYFGESSILRFQTHCCDLQAPSEKSDNVYYGVEIDENAMCIFSGMGDACRPPCTCSDTNQLRDYIDKSIQAYPGKHEKDYTLHTAKGDTNIEEVCQYALRDALQWWVQWHGSLGGHRWKHLWVAFSTVSDDIAIPPQDLADGSFRLLGNRLSDVLAGLRSEGVHPDDVKLLEMHLLRQYIVQYLEKVDPELRRQVLAKTTLMTQFRVMTAGAQGAALVVLAARGVKSLGSKDRGIEMAGICNCLSMDIAKEVLGILRNERTESVAGDNREQLKRELRWIYLRSLECLDTHYNTTFLRRFATSGFHFVFLNDRYRERVRHVRYPITTDLRRLIISYSYPSDKPHLG